MAAIEDPQTAAELAGLVHVDDAQPGIARRRRGKGFSYTGPRGGSVSASDRQRIVLLAIPPAWTEVWISPHPLGHIQATGRDDEGRKQYRYHDGWTQARAAEKFEQLGGLGRALPRLRRQIDIDLGAKGLDHRRVVALAVHLLDETLVRVGNRGSVARDSFGLTTLRSDHVEVEGADVTFEFTGKGGADHEIHLHDPRIARLVRRCDDVGGTQLFSYVDAGRVRAVASEDVNEYLRDHWLATATAHDFRAWGGSAAVVGQLGPEAPTDDERAELARYLAAVDAAAERLGNTRTVCRQSYVHPSLEVAASTGRLQDAWRRSRRTQTMDRAERALLHVLDQS